MNSKKILLIQTAFIGDVVLTTPMIRALHKHFPDHKLSILVKPEAKAILEHNPLLDNILVIDKRGKHKGLNGMRRILNEIKSHKFDVLLSPHKSHRTSILAIRSGIPERFGYKNAGLARFAYHHRLFRNTNNHEINRLLEFLDQSMGCNSDAMPRDLEIYIDETASQEAIDLLRELDCTQPVLLAPSSVWPTKRWTAAGFADLCQALNHKYRRKVLLVGSPDDFKIAEDITILLKKLYPENIARGVINICGKTSLAGLYALMTKSKLLVSNDSAPVHFGCAAKIPVVAIFGPTTPSLGYAPIASHSIVAELPDLGCRPCGTHGANVCPQEHFRCMKDLTAAKIMECVKQVL